MQWNSELRSLLKLPPFNVRPEKHIQSLTKHIICWTRDWKKNYQYRVYCNILINMHGILVHIATAFFGFYAYCIHGEIVGLSAWRLLCKTSYATISVSANWSKVPCILTNLCSLGSWIDLSCSFNCIPLTLLSPFDLFSYIYSISGFCF